MIAAVVSTYAGASGGFKQRTDQMSAKTSLLSASLAVAIFAVVAGLTMLPTTPAARAATIDCAAAKTQADLATCTAANAASADAGLNAVYKELAGRLAPTDLKRLREAQRAWIPFRDKECAFRTQPYAGGSVYATLVETCRQDLTKARLAQLQHQLQCPEGDLSCVPQTGGSAAPATAGTASAKPAAAQASRNDTRPCVQSAGKAKSDQYVSQCVQVSPATHPPCNGQNACSMMIDEIKRGCAMIGNDNPPAFCSAYKN
ncbi:MULTISPECIES: lysozyme inhibitor LprI family protein [unclassified Mesorhizobium]|uniref:lysozyme inhibitor LprI family protein n=1 Tax=unclassified Mesorhizobium TaxID=325217 RepID=UPI001CC91B01|nr:MULTISPECIES: lysozyme inhibitor LprI family protein [unclassified Mesorhizobium]MBZ9861554.1 lysozyme inhibitor LprI family protein [Mesorhizobium sp. CA12]MBZ9911778.1 lysozyme inhibitor LprI family protein [Mesorhizobium sp. CA16]